MKRDQVVTGNSNNDWFISQALITMKRKGYKLN